MSDCLKGKREAERNPSMNVETSVESKSRIRKNIDGSKAIKRELLAYSIMNYMKY